MACLRWYLQTLRAVTGARTVLIAQAQPPSAWPTCVSNAQTILTAPWRVRSVLPAMHVCLDAQIPSYVRQVRCAQAVFVSPVAWMTSPPPAHLASTAAERHQTKFAEPPHALLIWIAPAPIFPTTVRNQRAITSGPDAQYAIRLAKPNRQVLPVE